MNQAADQLRSPGRPKSETKRQEILQAAVKLFTDQGYVGTSVDDIALAAGVSKQTVYSHYGSKENLFALAVEKKCKESGFDSDLIDPNAEPREVLLELGRRFMALITSPEAVRVHCVCTTNAETHPELGQLFFENGPLRTVEFVSEYLEVENGKGRLEVAKPDEAAWQFFGMLKCEAHMRAQFNLRRQDKQEVDDYIAACVEMFLRAYTPRGA